MPAIPAPPLTISAPLVVLVACVLDVIFVAPDIVPPEKLALPVDTSDPFEYILPAYTAPPMPTPPNTCSAPVIVEVAEVVLVNVKMPDNVVAPSDPWYPTLP